MRPMRWGVITPLLLLVFVLWIVLSIPSAAVAAAAPTHRRHGKTNAAVVEGMVLCDTCFRTGGTRKDHLPGALVEVECRGDATKRASRRTARINSRGMFRAHLEAQADIHVSSCTLRLLAVSGSGGSHSCAVAANPTTSSNVRLRSRKGKHGGALVYNAGLFTFRNLSLPDMCYPKNPAPSSYSNLTSDNKAPAATATATARPQQLTPGPFPRPLRRPLPNPLRRPSIFPPYPRQPPSLLPPNPLRRPSVFPPNPLQPPLLPPNPITPPPSLLPPNPLTPPPSLLPPNPLTPPPTLLPPNPFQRPPPSTLPPNPFLRPPSPPSLLPPNPFQPPSPPTLLPPNPFQQPTPPPSLLPPNPFQQPTPPPSLLPPISNPFQRPPSPPPPFLSLPQIPGLTQPSSPPPPPSFRFPPMPFLPNNPFFPPTTPSPP